MIARPSSPWRLGALGLAALALFLLRDAVFRGQVFYERDVHLMWYTQTEAFVRSVLSGSWPVWNSWSGFGQPLWADANNQVLYPFTWLNLLLRPWTAYTLFVVFHLLFSGVGFLVLARRLRVSAGGAFVGAVLWCFGGPQLSLSAMWNQLAGAAWIPWLLVACVAALESAHPLLPLACGVALAAPILAGAPEAALMGLALVVCFALPRVLASEASERWRLLRTFGVALAFAVGLSAGQWLPSLEVASRSVRQALPAEVRSYWSVHPLNLLQALFPLPLHELSLPSGLRAELFESWDPFLHSLYLGLPALPLVLLGVRALGGRSRAVAALGLLSVLLALGRHAPFFDSAALLLPPLQAFRYPAKAMILAGFCWALLAAFGFDRLATSGRLKLIPVGAVAAALVAGVGAWLLFVEAPGLEQPLLRSSMAIVSGLLVAGVLFATPGPISARWAQSLLAVIITCDLLVAHADLVHTAPRELYTYRPEILAHVSAEDGSRLYVYDYQFPGKVRRYLDRDAPYLAVRAPAGWDAGAAFPLGLRMYLFPPSAGAFGLAGSYDADVAGLAPVALDRLGELLRATEGTPAHTRLLQLAAVRRVVALHQQGFEDLALLARVPNLYPEPTLVFEVNDSLPRAYAVSQARASASVSDLSDPGFEPKREVLLPGPSRAGRPGFEGLVRIVELRPDGVSLEADLNAPGYVVVVNAYDPGWRVTVDGARAELLPANLVFCGVAVGAGRHAVEFRYRPPAVFWGLTVSCLCALGGVTAIARAMPRSTGAANAVGSQPPV